MTHDDDMMIREAARRICAKLFSVDDFDAEGIYYGSMDGQVEMNAIEEGIRKGIEIGRAL